MPSQISGPLRGLFCAALRIGAISKKTRGSMNLSMHYNKRQEIVIAISKLWGIGALIIKRLSKSGSPGRGVKI